MENEVKKIKVQKRTPTEKQLESLEKARLSKQKKKIIKEHTQSTEPSSFLSPPPYMTGLILLGCAGLAAYSLLKGQKSYPTMEKNYASPIKTLVSEAVEVVKKTVQPTLEPEEIQMTVVKPVNIPEQDFFIGSQRI